MKKGYEKTIHQRIYKHVKYIKKKFSINSYLVTGKIQIIITIIYHYTPTIAAKF